MSITFIGIFMFLYKTEEVMYQKILDKIKEYQTIIIHRHIIPDGDCMDCQIGLKKIIKNSFSNKSVYVKFKSKIKIDVYEKK